MAQKPTAHQGRYKTGQKRCQICETYIKWDGLWCPCCGYRLRSNPRSEIYKAKMHDREYIKPTNKVTVTLEQDSSGQILLHQSGEHEAITEDVEEPERRFDAAKNAIVDAKTGAVIIDLNKQTETA